VENGRNEVREERNKEEIKYLILATNVFRK